MKQVISRRRRCMLAVPGSSERKIEKSLSLGADCVFLDLEDAVAPSAKPSARQNLIRAFNELNWSGTVRSFRMNGLDTQWAIDDLVTVVEGAGENIDTVMIPKIKFPHHVQLVATMLDILERKMAFTHRIGMELLIEEVEGVQNIREISQASHRVESLIFGIGDYTRAQGVDLRDAFGVPRHYPGDLWHYQRSALAVAARVAGIDYVDGPWGPIADADGYRRECRLVRTLGGVGKWAIHPSQVAIATEEFSPSEEEIQNAVRWKAQFERASAQGVGAIKMENGYMLDEAALPLLEQILERARFYGLEIPSE